MKNGVVWLGPNALKVLPLHLLQTVCIGMGVGGLKCCGAVNFLQKGQRDLESDQKDCANSLLFFQKVA